MPSCQKETLSLFSARQGKVILKGIYYAPSIAKEGGKNDGKIDQHYLSVSIRSSVFFGWRCRAGGVISAVWVYNNKRFARSRENSATLNHAPGLRNCSPVARDQDFVAPKRLEIRLAGSTNGADNVLLFPSSNLGGRPHCVSVQELT